MHRHLPESEVLRRAQARVPDDHDACLVGDERLPEAEGLERTGDFSP
jgi:hypothetical protein